MTETYDFAAIEAKWQKAWEDERAFEAREDPSRPKYYCLEMYPYPSGRIHMGHVRNYSIGDVIARQKRMAGASVLHPIGWDALGMPAENAAIKHGTHPQTWTLDNVAHMRTQLKRMGISYDWSREVNTCLPDYYKWNQWIFLRMLERGLAFRKESWVNWCSQCQTVLANEQVVGGGCWRCDTAVTQKKMEQWFLKITAYADELLSGHAALGKWPEHVLQMQKNWIGRSTGAHVRFGLDGTSKEIEVFTTRIDTIYGATFLVVSAEHPVVPDLVAGPKEKELGAWVARTVAEMRKRRDIGETEKDGVDTGKKAVNPFTGERVPIWIANYVLMDYGTGAIMGVPAHDARDFEFARTYRIPIRTVIVPPDKAGERFDAEPAEVDRRVRRRWSIPAPSTASPRTGPWTRWAGIAEEKGFGRRSTIFRLRDWGISRQRYWGTPIPGHLLRPLRHRRRPRRRPARRAAVRRQAHGRGGLAPRAPGELRPHDVPEVPRPGPARDGHDGHVRRFVLVLLPLLFAPRDGAAVPARSRETLAARRPLHRRRRARHPPPHLLPVLHQGPAGLRPDRYLRALPALPGPGHGDQGRLGHVQVQGQHRRPRRDPGPLRSRRAAPVHPLRLAPGQGVRLGRGGAGGLLPLPRPRLEPSSSRTWTSSHRRPARPRGRRAPGEAASQVVKKTHQTIRKVTEDIGVRFHLNTAISSIMELYNLTRKERDALKGTPAGREALRLALESIIRLLSPFAPHLAEELWERTGHQGLLMLSEWPAYDAALARDEMATVVVQINGKVRDRFEAVPDLPEAELEAAALALPKIQAALGGKPPRKVISVKNKLVSIVS